jgi:TDG/mug DNA glycosylase family protein
MLSQGFPPVAGKSPTVLVLGSLPGRASLEAGQYYAQPRNAFWRIMGELCGAGPELHYERRLEALTAAGVAVWDVLFEAVRTGSLDANIVASTQRVNDVAGLIAANASLKVVAFNGRKAADVYRRKIAPDVSRQGLLLSTLPSTSPAYASLGIDEKLAAWRTAIGRYLRAI